MNRKQALQIAIPFAVAFVAVVVVRLFFVTQFTLRTSALSPTLLAGDRVLVNRTAYGVRMPGELLFGYHRLGSARAKRGDWMAFYNPGEKVWPESNRSICMAQCTAAPGDTIWMDAVRKVVTVTKQSTDAVPFVVPAAGSATAINTINARMLCHTLMQHENCRANLTSYDRIKLDNRLLRYATVTQDYYWVSTADGNDSRQFGLVPASALIGRIFAVSYSTDAQYPFYTPFRKGRFFRSVDQ